MRVPWDAYDASDSDSESDGPDDDLQGDTELKQLLATVKTMVTSLFRLSMAIRDPAPTSQSTRTITIDKSYFQQHDILHVQAKYPRCPDYLTNRLGRAISGRRQYLSYREEHHSKLSKGTEKLGFDEPRTGETVVNVNIYMADIAQSIRQIVRKRLLCPHLTARTA